MRTHGHREGSITYWGLSGGGITWGEMPDIGDGGMKAANHIAMYVPMKQSCMICTCTPESKVQLKKKKRNLLHARHGGSNLWSQHFGRPGQVDHLRSGVQGQPGQHGEIPSLLKIQN